MLDLKLLKAGLEIVGIEILNLQRLDMHLALNMLQLILIQKLLCSRIEIQSKKLEINHSKLNLEGSIIIPHMAIMKTLKLYRMCNHIKVKIENSQLLNQDLYHEIIKNKEFQILLQTTRNEEF